MVPIKKSARLMLGCVLLAGPAVAGTVEPSGVRNGGVAGERASGNGVAGATIGADAIVTDRTSASPEQASPELAYQVTEGRNINAFLRDGAAAAHVLLRSGREPRILVAFPAGNSGVGLWFAPLEAPARWTLDSPPAALVLPDAQGRILNGVRFLAAIDAPALEMRDAVLSNVRVLRDYQATGRFPAEVAAAPRIADNRLEFARDRIDGAPGYHLALEILSGRLEGRRIIAEGGGPIRVAITAATGDPALTGLGEAELLNDRAAADPAARKALRFLSYREKFLAGSWRFNTYFGRDTLMSVRLLMPALQPAAIEAGLASVLARLDPEGEVAHEEAVSEFAILARRAAGEAGDAATLDYAMVDDDFMLAPVAERFLLGHADRARAKAWLASPVAVEAAPGTSATVRTLLLRNLRFVVAAARPFAATPTWQNLVALKPGRRHGQWRDSDEGLGGGRYPYDVNAVLVPAALEAAARLATSGLLGDLAAEDRALLTEAQTLAQIWREKVPAMFRVCVPADEARVAVTAYARALGVPPGPALAALPERDLAYHAIALDEAGRPVPIIHSDEGFALLFADPAPADLEMIVASVMRPFPAGLMTDVGMVVANAALAERALQADFTPANYHGAVVWSWQQALFAAGLERQLERSDLPDATRAVLRRAQADLWQVIMAARDVQSSELWSWAHADGRYRIVPFGAGGQDVDESNAAQLWSTVYLAVRPPR